MKAAIIFPGQGSQKPGMGKSIYDADPMCREIFSAVKNATQIDVAKLCFESDEATLKQTKNTQIALFTVSISTWTAIESRVPNLMPIATAGHSVGEYAALVCSNILSLDEAAKLVVKRGELMQAEAEKKPGAMAAVLGLNVETVNQVCKEASRQGIVVLANDNCPGQIVISGQSQAVDAAIEIAKSKGSPRVIKLNVSGGFHSPLMSNAAIKLQDLLLDTTFHKNRCPVFSNVTAKPEGATRMWVKLLSRQVESAVRWTESVKGMIQSGADLFIECGTGEVLTGLLKRIDPSVRGIAVNDENSLNKVVSEVSV